MGAFGTVLLGGGEILMAADETNLKFLSARFRKQKHVCCHPIDWKKPRTVDAFFEAGHSRFGRLDTVLIEHEALSPKGTKGNALIEDVQRRLLRCIDAMLPYTGSELHIIVIGPAEFGDWAMSATAMYCAVKLKDTKQPKWPTVRMTAICTTLKAGKPISATALLVSPASLPLQSAKRSALTRRPLNKKQSRRAA
jgi:hypothetical protein